MARQGFKMAVKMYTINNARWATLLECARVYAWNRRADEKFARLLEEVEKAQSYIICGFGHGQVTGEQIGEMKKVEHWYNMERITNVGSEFCF